MTKCNMQRMSYAHTYSVQKVHCRNTRIHTWTWSAMHELIIAQTCPIMILW